MKCRHILTVAASWFLVAGTASAQFPRHSLTSILPAGGQAGTTVEVVVGGAELDGGIGLEFDHPGIRAFQVKGPKFVVAISPDVPPGHHDVRIAGPLGVSGPRAFLVGERGEVREVEPNNTPETAQSIAIGTVINGRMDAAPDVDSFAFDGVGGQSIVVEIATAAIDTKLDAAFRLISPTGRELVAPSDLPGPQPSVAIRLPECGHYLLQVHDLVYAGTPDHGYRLSIRGGSRIAAVRPEPGLAGGVAAIGRNLESKSDASAWVPLPVSLVPTSGSPRPSGQATARGAWYRAEDPSGPSNQAFLIESTDPSVPESEPNDGPDRVQHLVPPCEVVAEFGSSGDIDRFRFHASRGQALVVEVMADRIGTPVDAEFVVRKALAPATEKDLLAGDDLPDPLAGKRFPLGSLDPRVLFQAPEDGDYEVVVRDVHGASRTDSSLLYRLRIRPERPDYDLIVVPNDGVTPEGTTVRAGGRTSIYALVHRIDGLTGPIRVEARDLPPGVTSEPVVIGPNQVMAPLILTADPGAVPALGTVHVVGRNISGDRKEALDHAPGRKIRPEIEREALSGTIVWPTPAAGGEAPPIALARSTTSFVMAVREGAPFQITARPASLVLGPEESAEVTIDIERHAGFVEAVSVAVSDLPPNLTPPAAVTIAKDKSSATLKLTIPKNVPPGPYTIVFRGSGPFPFSKDPNARTRPNVTVNEPSNAVMLTIRR